MKPRDYTDDAAMARLGRECELQRQREAIERDMRACFARITRPGWNEIEDEMQAMEALLNLLRNVCAQRQQLDSEP